MRKLVRAVVCLFGLCGTPLFAQDAPLNPVPAGTKGIVTGHVSCADTGLPARFTMVTLQPEKEPDIPKVDPKKMDFGAILQKVMQGGGPSALTDMDGAFRMENVPPGVYYLIPQLSGYLSPLAAVSSEETMKSTPEIRKLVQSHAQKVVVEAAHVHNVDVRIERGASISGEILYDDGSPAPNVVAHLFKKQTDGTWKQFNLSVAGINFLVGGTDDHGRFRISGLPPGEYGYMAELPVAQVAMGGGVGSVSVRMHPGDALQVFYGNVFRQKEMKGFSVSAGEEFSGANLTFPVNGLFRISGVVTAKRDSHAVNTGSIELQDATDKVKLRSATVANDGTFTLQNVPAGEYLLHVSGAADIDPDAKPETLGGGMEFLAAIPGVSDALRKHSHDYGTADLPISVHGEVTAIALSVPETTTNSLSDPSAAKK